MAIFYIWIAIVVYFIPTLIGFHRQKKSKWGLFVTNLLFGWTLLGWIIAFIWSLS